MLFSAETLSHNHLTPVFNGNPITMLESTPPSLPEPPAPRQGSGAERRELTWLRSPWFLGLFLSLAVLAVYSNSLRGEWIYDDYADILGNQAIQKLWPLKDHFLETVRGRVGVHPRPFVGLTFTLNFLMGRNDTLIFHLTNLIIHLLATLCLFDLVRRTLRRLEGMRWASQSADLLAFFSALLWGIHPLQTESVAYITQRYESLMGLLVLFTLVCVVRSTQSLHPSRWAAAAALSCLLALASKEVAVSLPILVLLYDRTFLAGSFRAAWRKRRPIYLAMGVLWILFAWNQSQVGGRQFAGYGLPWPWWQYALNQPTVVLYYLRLAVWPEPLVLDYAWRPAAAMGELLPGFLVIGGLLAGTVVGLLRNSGLGFLGACFFLILAPTSSIMPILDMAVEHRMYLPLAPVLVGLVLGLHFAVQRIVSNWPRLAAPARVAVLAIGASAVGILGSLAYLRNEDYRSSLNIWMDTVFKRPANARAHGNYGHALQRAGNLEEAIAQTRYAVLLAPDSLILRGNLGAFLEEKGLHEEAIQELLRATRIDPGDSRPWVNLGLIYRRMKNLEKAEESLWAALRLDPWSAQAHFELGILYGEKKRFADAMDQFHRAMQLQPGFSLPHWGAAQELLKQGRLPEALKEYEIYIGLETKPAKALTSVGRSLAVHGRLPEAFDHWRRALQRDPEDVSTMLLMAWTLSTHPQTAVRNGAEALALAEKAFRLKGKSTPATLEVLGTAYAELGRFPEACQVTENAIAQLKVNPAADLTKVEDRLALFRRGEPYREDPAVKASP